jgi:hypothetical protein
MFDMPKRKITYDINIQPLITVAQRALAGPRIKICLGALRKGKDFSQKKKNVCIKLKEIFINHNYLSVTFSKMFTKNSN